MNQMPGTVEGETILRERAAESAYCTFLLENDRIVLSQMITRTHTGKTAADDDDPFFAHERMSTFSRRYAERNAAEIAPNMVAAAHASVTWLIRSAMPLSRAPII